MAEEIAENAGSAPASQDTNQIAPQAANTADSATANETGTQTVQPSEPTAPTGSEPVLGEKGVAELVTTRKRAQNAEQEAAYWRGVAEGRKTESAPVQQPKVMIPEYPQAAPRLEHYEDIDKYNADRDKYITDKTKWEIREEQNAQTQQSQIAQLENTWQSRLKKAAENIPEIEQIAKSPNLVINKASAAAVKSSEAGPQIVKYLFDNPEEAKRISDLHPVDSVREIGKLEAKLANTSTQSITTNRISQAPEPVKPIGNAGSLITTDLDKMSTDDFMKKRNAETTVKVQTARGTRVVLR